MVGCICDVCEGDNEDCPVHGETVPNDAPAQLPPSGHLLVKRCGTAYTLWTAEATTAASLTLEAAYDLYLQLDREFTG